MVQLFIAMLMFTFFALSGLVVDLGLVRLTQRQMIGSTDAAALEGMRLRDTLDDVDRRAAARTMLRDHFDDDFHATAGDALQFGAGPRVTLTGGTGSMAANQQVVVHPDVVYKPDPQLNLSNALHGDMVAGGFDPQDLMHIEGETYLRTDFGVISVADPSRWDAFLVRLRRTTGTDGPDNIPGVSSHGPTLPYLFSRGSMLAPDLRARGVVVRATSIAAARNGTAAGRPRPDLGLMGYGPLTLEYDLWQALGDTFTLEFGSEGGSRGRGGGRDDRGRPRPNPFPFGPPIVPPGQEIGNIDVPNWGFLLPPEDIGSLSIGQRTPVIGEIRNRSELETLLATYGVDTTDLAAGETLFFVPIYWGDLRPVWDGVPGNKWDTVDGNEGVNPRLIGFGAIEILSVQLPDEDDESLRFRVQVRKRSSSVWPTNISAVQTPGLADLSPSQAREISQLNEAIDDAARAAAIVR